MCLCRTLSRRDLFPLIRETNNWLLLGSVFHNQGRIVSLQSIVFFLVKVRVYKFCKFLSQAYILLRKASYILCNNNVRVDNIPLCGIFRSV